MTTLESGLSIFPFGRIRRHHGIEHATLQVLTDRYLGRLLALVVVMLDTVFSLPLSSWLQACVTASVDIARLQSHQITRYVGLNLPLQ